MVEMLRKISVVSTILIVHSNITEMAVLTHIIHASAKYKTSINLNILKSQMDIPNRQTMGSRAGPPKVTNNLARGPQSRIGTAVLLSLMKGMQPIAGIGANTNINIVNRPVTKEGIAVSNNDLDPGRQVYDRNFYVNKLKERLQLIYGQIENFKKRGEELTKEQYVYNKLETKYEELRKEVRNLQGQLADYNLTIDKIRVNTRPQDVRNAYTHVKAQNQKFKNELDHVFLERKKYEQGIESIQSQLQSIHEQMELRLNELDPGQRNQYKNLINENKELINQFNIRQRDLEELNNKLANAQAKLHMDSQKMKGQLLKEQLAQLEGKKGDLEIQLNEANLSIPQARDRILARMKEDNNLIAATEKRSREVKKNIEMCQKRLRELDASLQDKKTEEEDKKKYSVIQEREKQMDSVINSFDKTREEQLAEMDSVQKTITELLQQISTILKVADQLPTKDTTSTTYKADKSKNTLAQAKTEYEFRLRSLRGLEGAQERTVKEIEQLQGKIKKMQTEIDDKFKNIDKFKDQLYRKKQRLIKDQKQLQAIKTKSAAQVSKVQYELNILQKKMQMHQAFGAYTEVERRLSQLEAQRYYMKSYINIKSKDMKYEDIRAQCLKCCDDLNKKLQR